MTADLDAAFAELARIYAGVDVETADRDCKRCGRCCHFESYGHRVYATRLEALYLLARCGAPPRPLTGKRCGYQDGALCTARTGRVLGCRTFFCDDTGGSPSELHEKALASIGEISQRFGIARGYRALWQHMQVPVDRVDTPCKRAK